MDVKTMAMTAALVGACLSAWMLASRLTAIMGQLQKLHNDLRENDRALERTFLQKPLEVESSPDE